MQKMKQMLYYCKGANAGSDDEVENGTTDCKSGELDDDVHGRTDTVEEGHVSSKIKRSLFNSITKEELIELIEKVEFAYNLHCSDKFQLTVEHPAACKKWFSADIDRRIPFQEKHVLQQASMLGNMESFGLLRSRDSSVEQVTPSNPDLEPVFVEFGAGRGYLAHMLADCYIAQKIVLVERRSYKFKADRTLRQNPDVVLERVRIDIEDLNLDGVDALQDRHYVAFSKHLCGHATDLTLRCCRPDLISQSSRRHLDGLAIATCCHHICQWKPYVNKEFFKQLGFSKKEFHVITWLTSGAVSGNKGHAVDARNLSASCLNPSVLESPTNFEGYAEEKGGDNVNGWLTSFVDRAEFGLKCKRLLDVGRFYWLKQVGMNARLVAYVSPEVTPENTLLLASLVAVRTN
ncbi:hypothetical protein GOP47_0025075 [Adiantum capillus-veneris]|uniref:tRNA:m(4)X modification enzyme TRM13 n=1 Tax=Adiantum capillus-veneris TaxID=13818 RepID=A0A9D4Z485_ADICA|nr:hypothetical protein GOP47_0025075 [Adiantum capillus-veneris]